MSTDALAFSKTIVGPKITELIEDIDARALPAATRWLEEIAPMIEAATHNFGLQLAQRGTEHTYSADRWEHVTKPILLWRFYGLLAAELEKIAEGHRTVFETNREGER